MNCWCLRFIMASGGVTLVRSILKLYAANTRTLSKVLAVSSSEQVQLQAPSRLLSQGAAECCLHAAQHPLYCFCQRSWFHRLFHFKDYHPTSRERGCRTRGPARKANGPWTHLSNSPFLNGSHGCHGSLEIWRESRKCSNCSMPSNS